MDIREQVKEVIINKGGIAKSADFVAAGIRAVTGVLSFLVAHRNAISQINIVKENNKHEIDRLMEQHKIDIDSLKEKMAALSDEELKNKTLYFQKQFENVTDIKQFNIIISTAYVYHILYRAVPYIVKS